jgi:hypothetical protein
VAAPRPASVWLMRIRTRTVAAVVGAGAAVLALSACMTTYPTEEYRGDPEGIIQSAGGEDEGVMVSWLEQGTQIALTTWGSSGCPVVGSHISVVSPAGQGNTVKITVEDIPDDQVCTMDYVPHTSVFWTPQEVITGEPLTVQVLGEELELPVK